MATATGAFKRLGLEVLGWVLVVGGIAALILPGPGLLLLLAGLVLLSQQYDWARRRLEPVRNQAFKTAAAGVATWPRIIGSTLGALVLIGLGVFWGVGPDVPGWWPLKDEWWLIGGWGTGSSLIISGVVAAALIVYSYRKFRDRDPDAAAPESAAPGQRQ